MSESIPGVVDYERLINAYKDAVILYYDGASDERATEMRRRRAALDAYVEGLEDALALVYASEGEVIGDYLLDAIDAARREAGDE
jgi:hypothetical protein